MYRRINKLREPAYGQVLVVPFAETQEEAFGASLDSLETAVIIKPQFKTPYLKWAGGMLGFEGEEFTVAATKELAEETGITCLPENCVEIYRTQKPQFKPHTGEFDLVLYLAFECDFSTMFNPLFGEVGDEAEEPYKVCFGDILKPGFELEIPTVSGLSAGFFPQYYRMLQTVGLARA